jgi:hypothetical protein
LLLLTNKIVRPTCLQVENLKALLEVEVSQAEILFELPV